MNVKLKDFLELLSLNNIDLKKEKQYLTTQIEEIYSQGYRHSYSEIFKITKSIEDSEDKTRNLLNVITNLDYIRLNYSFSESDIVKSLDKLIDHINLEWARKKHLESSMSDLYGDIKGIKHDNIVIKKETQDINESSKKIKNFIDSQNEEFSKRISRLEELNKNINDLTLKMEKAERKIKNSKYDLVTIISIMFSIFTILGVNTSIIAGVFSLAGGGNFKNVPLFTVIILFIIANLVIFAGISYVFKLVKDVINDSTENKN